MEKIANEKIAQVLRDAANAFRTITAERDEALSKLSALERRRDAEKLASAMHNKGIKADVEIEELADSLEKAATQGRLPIIQEAVDMMGRNMSLGHINNDEVAHTGASDLERYVFGDIG